jgi:hypothetical protein
MVKPSFQPADNGGDSGCGQGASGTVFDVLSYIEYALRIQFRSTQ